ncbi:hypothetical protein Dimus_039448 [Dionaea muscipula]
MESVKENKKLMDDLASREADLASREADLKQLSELFKIEEQKTVNLEAMLESVRKEKEKAEGKIISLEAEKTANLGVLEAEKKQRKKAEEQLKFTKSRLRTSKEM